MDIGLGMHVYTSDGQDVGSVDRLILDPDTNQVKAAVIRKGTFMRHDVEVPRDMMNVTPDGTIRLSATADEVKSLPEFDPGAYTDAPPDYRSPAGYPSEGLYLPFGYAPGIFAGAPGAVPGAGILADNGGIAADDEEARELAAAWRRQDLENAVVQEGSKVLSRDGEEVGKVHQLNFDPQSGKLTGIVVRRGILFAKETELPASLVSGVGDGVVTLSVNADEVKNRMT